MANQVRLTVFIASVATIASIDGLNAQVRQCSAAAPAGHHGYWSYRLIDGRKCWYEGKTRISKSLLEWPARAPPRTSARAPVTAGADEEPAREHRETAGSALDANAWDRDDVNTRDGVDTFETRWRAISTRH